MQAVLAWIYLLAGAVALAIIITATCFMRRAGCCSSGEAEGFKLYADLMPQLRFAHPNPVAATSSLSSDVNSLSHSRSCNSIAESPYEGTTEGPG